MRQLAHLQLSLQAQCPNETFLDLTYFGLRATLRWVYFMRILIVLSFWFPVLIAHAQVEEGDPLKVAGKEGARERVSEFELETPGGAHSAEQPVSSVSSADLIAKPRPNASTEKAPVSRASPDAKTEIQQLIKENRQPQAREIDRKSVV